MDELSRFIEAPTPERLIERLANALRRDSLVTANAAFTAAVSVLIDRGVPAEALKAGIDAYEKAVRHPL